MVAGSNIIVPTLLASVIIVRAVSLLLSLAAIVSAFIWNINRKLESQKRIWKYITIIFTVIALVSSWRVFAYYLY
jgi:uncharacterized membrane protein YphA (DoxX/SURF4 family)